LTYDQNSIEYYNLYKVNKDEYESCTLNDINLQQQPILKCDKPYENVRYTLYIAKFSPIPDAIEFIPGNSYYFICKFVIHYQVIFLFKLKLI
jgi:hypothetical protein